MNEALKHDDSHLFSSNKSISTLAIVALALSLVSTIYILIPVLVLLPIATVLLAMAALYRVSTNDNIEGLLLACLALFVSTFSLTAVLTYKTLRHQHMASIAEEHSRTWLQMVQEGEIFKSFQLTQEYPQRVQPQVALESVYMGQSTDNIQLTQYVTQQPELAIRTDGDLCQLINEGMVDYKTSPKKERFVFRYRLKRADPEQVDQVFDLEMLRTDHFPPLGPRWTCFQIVNIEPSSQRFERKLLQFLK